jgi:hypothetical protein
LFGDGGSGQSLLLVCWFLLAAAAAVVVVLLGLKDHTGCCGRVRRALQGHPLWSRARYVVGEIR